MSHGGVGLFLGYCHKASLFFNGIVTAYLLTLLDLVVINKRSFNVD